MFTSLEDNADLDISLINLAVRKVRYYFRFNACKRIPRLSDFRGTLHVSIVEADNSWRHQYLQLRWEKSKNTRAKSKRKRDVAIRKKKKNKEIRSRQISRAIDKYRSCFRFEQTKKKRSRAKYEEAACSKNASLPLRCAQIASIKLR